MAKFHLTLYSRPGCRLCDEMKAMIERVARRVPLVLQEIDISADADLEGLYGRQIPVLLIGDRQVAKHRIGEAELLRQLAAGNW